MRSTSDGWRIPAVMKMNEANSQRDDASIRTFESLVRFIWFDIYRRALINPEPGQRNDFVFQQPDFTYCDYVIDAHTVKPLKDLLAWSSDLDGGATEQELIVKMRYYLDDWFAALHLVIRPHGKGELIIKLSSKP